MKQDAESTQGEATEHSAHLQLAPNRLLAKRGSKNSYQQDELCHCQVTLLASKLTCCPTFRWVREKQFQYFVKQNNGLDFFLGKKKKVVNLKKKSSHSKNTICNRICLTFAGRNHTTISQLRRYLPLAVH